MNGIPTESFGGDAGESAMNMNIRWPSAYAMWIIGALIASRC